MKKVLTIAILFVMVALMATTVVNATTSANLAEELYNLGSKYGMTSADKVKIERYLADNPVTESEANQIMNKAREATKIMDEAGVTDITKLSQADKNKLVSIANEAASIIGLTLSFKSGGIIEVYKDGKLIETATLNNGKLAYTGNDNTVLVVSSVAVLALATVFVVRKKFANA